MKMHETLTLDNIKQRPSLTEGREFRASDFLTEDEQQELREVNARGRNIRRPFDEVDSFAAEIMARFGWDAYQAWLDGRSPRRLCASSRPKERAKSVRCYHSRRSY